MRVPSHVDRSRLVRRTTGEDGAAGGRIHAGNRGSKCVDLVRADATHVLRVEIGGRVQSDRDAASTSPLSSSCRTRSAQKEWR